MLSNNWIFFFYIVLVVQEFIFNKINIDLFIKDVNYLELETKWTFIYSIDIYMYMSIHLLGAQTDSFFMINSFPYIV